MKSSSEADRALRELRKVGTQSAIWRSLAFSDIRSKYRLSTLGSLWITLTTGALALSVGLIYGQFFGQDIHAYLPYFTASYITWMLIVATLTESSMTLTSAGNIIKSSQMPIVFHIMRMLQRNFIIAAHNAVVLAAVWPFVRWHVGPGALMSIAGLALLYLFLGGASIVLAIICARYRDVPPLVQVLMQFLFFATPVIWYPEQLRFGEFILTFNPLAYLLMAVRDPILGRAVALETWFICTCLAATSVSAGVLMYIRYRKRIAYWV